MSFKSVYTSKPWLKSYNPGIPAEIEIPEMTIGEAFDQGMERWGDRTAMIFYGNKITYTQLKEQVDRFATALHDLGVKQGDTVALFLLNSPQFIIAYFAALKLGAIITAISPVYVAREVKHQIEDSGTKVIICQDMLYETIERSEVTLDTVILANIGEYLPGAKKLLGKNILRSVYRQKAQISPEVFKRKGFYQFQDLLKKYAPNPPKVDIDCRQPALLGYTGGTTGLPKGATLSHYNFIASAMQDHVFWQLDEGKETLIGFLPFYHFYGQVAVMWGSMVRGYTLIVFTTPDFDDILGAVEKYKATAFFSVSSMYNRLRDYHKTDRVNWKRLKLIATGGDALLKDTFDGWRAKTGTTLCEGLGLTEDCASQHSSPVGKEKFGSFGVPIPNTVGAIIDSEGTEFLPVGQVGEVIVKGPQVMIGYWNQPEETKKVLIEIDGETWLKTGDLASMDEDGYFYFYDRAKDMIKYKGYSVFAREIEEVLVKHPSIKEAGIIGIPDPTMGQIIKAIVVPHTEARGKITEEELIDYCKENLAHYKIPKILEFRGEIPKTDVGKVSRRELREEIEL